MKPIFTIPLFLILPILAQGAGEMSTKDLIKSLGSANFKERLAAENSLKELPNAEPALREALSSGSFERETKRRIEDILDYYARRPLREMDAAADGGRVDDFVEILATLPPGKLEKEGWLAFRRLAERLAKLHEDKGGEKLGLFDQWVGIDRPHLMSAERISRQTKPIEPEGPYFLRTWQFDVCDHVLKKPAPEMGKLLNQFGVYPLVASRRTVRSDASNGCIIMAGGSVEIYPGPSIDPFFVLSGGDVLIHGGMVKALIIAKGKVTILDGQQPGPGSVIKSRIISGKSVSYDKARSAATDKESKYKPAIISENDPNPLGFIRWADAPKDKVEPKKK